MYTVFGIAFSGCLTNHLEPSDRLYPHLICILKDMSDQIWFKLDLMISCLLSEYLLCKNNIKWMLLTIFLYALFWTGPPLVGWSSYVQEPFKTSCTVNWTGKSAADISYNTLCTVFCYFFPVAIFFFSYYNVVKTTSVSNR